MFVWGIFVAGAEQGPEKIVVIETNIGPALQEVNINTATTTTSGHGTLRQEGRP